jgi:hypothetical protein
MWIIELGGAHDPHGSRVRVLPYPTHQRPNLHDQHVLELTSYLGT